MKPGMTLRARSRKPLSATVGDAMPTFEKPSVADLHHAADQLGMNPSMMYLNTVQDILGPLVAAYAALDAVPDEKPAVKYPRDGGWRPTPDENKLGAWYMKTS